MKFDKILRIATSLLKLLKKIITSLVIVILLTNSLQAKVKFEDIKFAPDFYAQSIQTCKAIGNRSFKNKNTVKRVSGLVGYDWMSDWKKNSNSLTVKHINITEPILWMMTATHNAVSEDDKESLTTGKELLVKLAKANTLLDSTGYHELKNKPMCWKNNDPNSPCWYHSYEFAKDVFSLYLISAIWLKDELDEDEFQIVDRYINRMYRKFLKPLINKKQDQGFYAMANGGTGILIYANWSNDKRLAVREINNRLKYIDKVFLEDGYINNNSFRGYRGQWYHSYGLNSVLGYVYIAKLWGAKIPNKIQQKLIKASEITNLAITDWDKFKSREFAGANPNKISNKDNAIKHTHQMAFSLDALMEVVTGVKLENDPIYLQKRKYHMKDGFDSLIGFNAHCLSENLN